MPRQAAKRRGFGDDDYDDAGPDPEVLKINLYDKDQPLGYGIPVTMTNKTIMKDVGDHGDEEEDDKTWGQPKTVKTRYKNRKRHFDLQEGDDQQISPRDSKAVGVQQAAMKSAAVRNATAAVAAGPEAVKDPDDPQATETKRKKKKEKEERNKARKENQLIRAKGCRRPQDEILLILLLVLYLIITVWGWVMWVHYRGTTDSTYYDSANNVVYEVLCADRRRLVKWWFWNGLITTVFIGLWVLS